MVFWLHIARTGNPDTHQTHPSASDFHEYHSDTPRHPPYTPETYPGNLKCQQTPTDTNGHPQTPSINDRCCLSKSGSVCWCPLWSVGILCSLEMSRGVWGISGGYLGVSEWYSWKLEAIRCVWGLLGSHSLQYGAVTLYWHSSERQDFYSPDHTDTSTYQNVYI